MRISLIADVHYRGLSRHAELREIFEFFVEDCRRQNVDHIFIAGDLFHSKTMGISPEVVDEIVWWLKLMASVAEVHIILGNHDGNLTNLSRQDAISPIVNALDSPHVHLYKTSGTYEFSPGFTWCNFGVFDPEGWKNVRPKKDCINIACFHGPVAGSCTETGYEVVGDVDTSFFDDYDFVFLGDIHKHQELAYRLTASGVLKPRIAYPGSVAQNSYGESIDHGYLLWDIKSTDDFDVEFRSLPNPRPYITLCWTGTIDELVERASEYPDRSRIRVRSDSSLTQKDVSQITSALQKFNPTEVTYKIDRITTNDVIDTGTLSLIRDDLRNPSVLLSLVKDYYRSSVLSMSDDEWTHIGNLIENYLKTIDQDKDIVRNTTWSMKAIDFDNTFSYGGGNSIDLTQLEGVTGIFGMNRAGKSSIVGTIMYVLFNASDRGPIKNQYIVNVRHDSCRARALISVNGSDYVIERQTSNKSNKKGVQFTSTTLTMQQIDEDGSLIDLKGEQRIDTDRTIRKMIGSADDFVLTSFSTQDDHNRFIKEGSTQRKLILAKFLDIDIFDSMHDIVKKDVNDTKVSLKTIQTADWDSEIEKKNRSISSLQSDVSSIEHDLERKRSDLESLKVQMSSKWGQIVVVSELQVKNQRFKVEQLRTKLSNLSDEIKKIRLDVSLKSEKLMKIDELKKKFDPAEMKKRIDDIRELEHTVKDLTHEHQVLNTELKRQERSVKQLTTVPCGDSFPTCKFIKDTVSDKALIESHKEKTTDTLKRLGVAVQHLSDTNSADLIDKINKFDKIKDVENKLTVEVSASEVALHRCEMTEESTRLLLEKEVRTLESYEESFNSEIHVEMIEARKELTGLQSCIMSLDADKTKLISQIGRTMSDIDSLSSSQKRSIDLQTKLRHYEVISNAFSKKGIPSTIVARQLPVINAEISTILSGIVDFTVELDIEPDSNEMPIYINYGDSRRVIELCSGMEKMISSLAIRIALLNVSSLPKPDFFIIDEGFGTLDAGNIEACDRLLKSLKRYFKHVFVISHVDGIKDAADNILEITKNEKDARLVYP